MTRLKKLCALLLVCMLVITAGAISVNAQSTDDSSATADNSSKLIIHYKGDGTTSPYVYYWNSLPVNINEPSYPGKAMTADASQIGENWYTYSFENITKINLLFTDKDGKQISEETSRNTEAHSEWWFKNGRWYNYNPDDTDPVEFSDLRGDSIYFVM